MRALVRTRALAIAVALICALHGVSAAGSVLAVPALDGHVVDMTGAIARSDVLALDGELEAYRVRTGNAIVVLVVPALGGEPIDDVAYRAFNSWGVGDAQKDNGILIVIAPTERLVRIETGKGVGGAVTDLQANAVIKTVIGPQLAAGHMVAAIDAGATALEAALDTDRLAQPVRRVAPPPPTPRAWWVYAVWIGVAALVIAIIVLCVVFPGFRQAMWIVLVVLLKVLWVFGWLASIFGGRDRGGGGGGGGGSGSGYSGGGGHSGGGGSTDSY